MKRNERVLCFPCRFTQLVQLEPSVGAALGFPASAAWKDEGAGGGGVVGWGGGGGGGS